EPRSIRSRIVRQFRRGKGNNKEWVDIVSGTAMCASAPNLVATLRTLQGLAAGVTPPTQPPPPAAPSPTQQPNAAPPSGRVQVALLSGFSQSATSGTPQESAPSAPSPAAHGMGRHTHRESKFSI